MIGVRLNMTQFIYDDALVLAYPITKKKIISPPKISICMRQSSTVLDCLRKIMLFNQETRIKNFVPQSFLIVGAKACYKTVRIHEKSSLSFFFHDKKQAYLDCWKQSRYKHEEASDYPDSSC